MKVGGVRPTSPAARSSSTRAGSSHRCSRISPSSTVTSPEFSLQGAIKNAVLKRFGVSGGGVQCDQRLRSATCRNRLASSRASRTAATAAERSRSCSFNSRSLNCWSFNGWSFNGWSSNCWSVSWAVCVRAGWIPADSKSSGSMRPPGNTHMPPAKARSRLRFSMSTLIPAGLSRKTITVAAGIADGSQSGASADPGRRADVEGARSVGSTASR
ncbi:unannotated protein [freshwater metagenome]|uniref:Unannotated protein n=1 Tax=freshwater metagenome TaxID=449393 RepID=A0A6J7NCF3_9ZZZZ